MSDYLTELESPLRQSAAAAHLLGVALRGLSSRCRRLNQEAQPDSKSILLINEGDWKVLMLLAYEAESHVKKSCKVHKLALGART
jgi:hypothetical protein